MELPLVTSEPHERADAARNRARILDAAERLFAERGVAQTSMDAIACAAGVGKGTLFRRFGDRASLAFAVLDGGERALQDGILRGPPPLGPGAPVTERLTAFGAALYDRLEVSADLLLDIERGGPGGYLRSEPYAVHRAHVASLVRLARPDDDVDYTTDLLLAPLDVRLVTLQRTVRGLELDRLKAGYADLVERVLA
jgi:AcrR family transcriptional regulator